MIVNLQVVNPPNGFNISQNGTNSKKDGVIKKRKQEVMKLKANY